MTTSSRDEILRRIRDALGDSAPRGDTSAENRAARARADAAALPRDYLTTHADRTPRQTTDLLAHNLTDYRAHVHHTNPRDLPATIARLLTRHGTQRAVTPPGLPEAWLTALHDTELVTATDTTTPQELDAVDTAITGCALAIAETGTIVLDASPDQGHRRITLVPDHHVCVIHPGQIVESLPQAIPRLDPTRPLTWISGPSATSDIELERVEGVHGPRTLDVILVSAPEE
ncbi:lactate utilization protein C [Streptomyces sp. NBC_01190]|uniref:LutC/YkgG family protein n=1 Tax=Streptomyces sp. NBC_01190 TaxID=2903767 RepID=UPI00386A376C|nr:LUD domain-containing protein [Streptomyces sp. NBC_01190]